MKDIENIALFDMDDTLCDYTGQMCSDLKTMLSPGEKFVDPFMIKRTLQNYKKYNYLWERMDRIKANEDWWANLPKLSLGFDIMELAKKLGYSDEILTVAPKTNPPALSGKLRWILKNIEDETDFTMTRNKARYYGRVLMDDYPEYLTSWLENRPRGLGIMPINRYNKDFRHPRVIGYDGTNLGEVKSELIKTLKRS